MSDIGTLYRRAHKKATDINEHLPTLAHYARQCRHVTEFGVRGGESTTAFVYAGPDRLECYDIDPGCRAAVQKLEAATGHHVRIAFHAMDTADPTLSIDRTDLLFIDTAHTAAQVRAELRHAPAVAKFIALHDVVTFGRVGDDGGPGILDAVEEFLAAHPEWKTAHWSLHNNGLAVLERTP